MIMIMITSVAVLFAAVVLLFLLGAALLVGYYRRVARRGSVGGLLLYLVRVGCHRRGGAQS
jgi:hypothetical protein